jgi:thiamine-phosphate pyrophosphorylase
MTRRQTVPEQWLIIDRAPGRAIWPSLRRLPRGEGVLLLQALGSSEGRHLLRLARSRSLTVVTEAPRTAARVHNMRELRSALLRRTPLVLLSPIYPTSSHPDWQPLPSMRAATLARLAQRRLLALGGMNHKRYAKIAALGFIGWAGISAFRI